MTPTTRDAPRQFRSDRRIAGRAQQDQIVDPYEARRKPTGPTACPDCGAIYRHGRWQWGERPAGARDDPCPACRRMRDRLPAGVLKLHGDFARRHESEIIALATNEEAAEKGEHPLNRIAMVETSDDGLLITTTDIHLPRRIGEAIKRAYRGSLDMHFDKAGYFLRAEWRAPS